MLFGRCGREWDSATSSLWKPVSRGVYTCTHGTSVGVIVLQLCMTDCLMIVWDCTTSMLAVSFVLPYMYNEVST